MEVKITVPQRYRLRWYDNDWGRKDVQTTDYEVDDVNIWGDSPPKGNRIKH